MQVFVWSDGGSWWSEDVIVVDDSKESAEARARAAIPDYKVDFINDEHLTILTKESEPLQMSCSE